MRANVVCAVMSAASVTPVWAQQAPPASPSQAASAPTTQTITVTATRPREFSDTPVKGYKADGTSALGFELELQQAPATVSVLTADFLKDAGIKGLGQALNLLPGVTIGDNTGTPREGILIRGYAAQPTINGIPQAVTSRPKFATLNIERIEVIKGIAGVEGNVDDFGGTIDLVTKKPQRSAAREFTAGVGDFGYKQITIDATGPLALAGALQYRLIGAATQPANWRPGRPEHNPRVELYPSLNWDYASGSNLLLELGFTRLNDPLDRGGLYIEGASFDGNFTPRDWSIHQSTDVQRQRFHQIDLTWNHRFNAAWAFKLNAQALRNKELSLGFRNGETEGSFLFADDGITWNGTGIDIPTFIDDAVNRYRSDGYTAELRGSFTLADVRHTVKAQVSASEGSSIYATGGVRVPLGFTPVIDNTISLFAPRNNNQVANIIGADGPGYPYFRDITDKRGVALQGLSEWTPRFRTLVGVRRETTDTQFGDFGADPQVIGVEPFGESQSGLKSRALRLGASFDVADDWTVFATYGSGSFAQSATARDGSALTDPKRVANIEAGVKWVLPGGKALATAAVYRLRERNLLADDCSATEPECRAQKLVGGRRIDGLEIDLRGELARELQIGAGLSLQDATILESPGGFSGNRFSNTPRVQATAFASYGWGAMGLAPLKTSLGVVHIGRRFGNSGNTVPLPAYTLLNLGARWHFNPATSLQLDAGNLLDKTYYTAMQDNDSTASDQVGIGERRLVQLALSHSF